MEFSTNIVEAYKKAPLVTGLFLLNIVSIAGQVGR